MIYGLVATTIAWQAENSLSSVLKLLLLGFAMVVPPAIAITFMFYVKRTSEKAVFWSIAAGFFGGLIHWGLNTLFEYTEYATAGGFGQYWHELMVGLGEWSDPTFSATLIPLVVILIMLVTHPEKETTPLAEQFYKDLAKKSGDTAASAPSDSAGIEKQQASTA